MPIHELEDEGRFERLKRFLESIGDNVKTQAVSFPDTIILSCQVASYDISGTFPFQLSRPPVCELGESKLGCLLGLVAGSICGSPHIHMGRLSLLPTGAGSVME